MKFKTTMNIQMPESVMLRDVESICNSIIFDITRIYKDDISPYKCADDLTDIIDNINELKEKVPELFKVFTDVDNMNSHLKKAPTHGK